MLANVTPCAKCAYWEQIGELDGKCCTLRSLFMVQTKPTDFCSHARAFCCDEYEPRGGR